MNLDFLLQSPIESHVEKFQKVYYDSLSSEIKLISRIINYASKNKGKQLRPRLCLLSACLCGEPNDNTYKAASLIEMIHVATLIHDDVVDESEIRRGWPSINRIWKSKLSILIGDYMFAKSLSNMIELRNFDALEVLSKTAERLSKGEISQIEKAIKKNMSEQEYYKMVSDKTASLFSASCEIGALTVVNDKEKCNSLSRFGEKFGLVFQIKDDLLDITGNVAGLGKPAGFDLKKNMLTLPLIYIFNKLDSKNVRKIKYQLNKYIKKSELNKIKVIIEENGGIDFAKNRIEELSNEAIDDLDIFPDSKYKSALIEALNFNISRTR